jgi:hypothetical protein
MLYHLLAPLGSQWLVFNLFTYISFRAAGAVVTALLIAFVAGPWIIRRLRELKVGQVIRAEGPASHQGKRGTPTMGGLIILPPRSCRPCSGRRSPTGSSWWRWWPLLWMGAIGFLDDYLKIVQGKSRGLVARWKLADQCTFGIALGCTCLVLAGGPRRPPSPRRPPRCRSSSTLHRHLRAVAVRGVRDLRGDGLQQRGQPDRRARRTRDRALAIAAGAFAFFAYAWVAPMRPPTWASSTFPGAGSWRSSVPR